MSTVAGWPAASRKLELDSDDRCGVLVLTGAGDSYSAGMDLKEYFREVDEQPERVRRRIRRDSNYWQWRLLRTYAKPTIAMVNGWCFGGAFTQACAPVLAAPRSNSAPNRPLPLKSVTRL